MRQKYEMPDMEVLWFDEKEIIRTSGEEDDETERLTWN